MAWSHSNGHCSENGGFFGSTYSKAPLAAPGRVNGIYAYGAGASFPSSSNSSTDYWVDVPYSA